MGGYVPCSQPLFDVWYINSTFSVRRDFWLRRTRFLIFQRDFWLRRTRFRTSYRIFQRFLRSAFGPMSSYVFKLYQVVPIFPDTIYDRVATLTHWPNQNLNRDSGPKWISPSSVIWAHRLNFNRRYNLVRSSKYYFDGLIRRNGASKSMILLLNSEN